MNTWDSLPPLPASEVTPQSIYENLRRIREGVLDGTDKANDLFNLTVAQLDDGELWSLATRMMTAFERWAAEAIRGDAVDGPIGILNQKGNKT